MIVVNPLSYPICLAYPLRVAPTYWTEHVPFAMFLVDVMRPKTVVELGSGCTRAASKALQARGVATGKLI